MLYTCKDGLYITGSNHMTLTPTIIEDHKGYCLMYNGDKERFIKELKEIICSINPISKTAMSNFPMLEGLKNTPYLNIRYLSDIYESIATKGYYSSEDNIVAIDLSLYNKAFYVKIVPLNNKRIDSIYLKTNEALNLNAEPQESFVVFKNSASDRHIYCNKIYENNWINITISKKELEDFGLWGDEPESEPPILSFQIEESWYNMLITYLKMCMEREK